jgi:seryl-tRNA synthetase
VINPHLLRDDEFEATATALARRGLSRADVQRLADLDVRRRELIAAVDNARAEQRSASKNIGQAGPGERQALIDRASELKAQTADLEAELAGAETAFEDALVRVPNLPHPDAPDGQEGDGVVLRTVGERPVFEHEPLDHVAIMEAADALDLVRGAKVSGARFAYLKNDGALLEFALVRYALDIAQAHGHVPVIPPVLVRREAMYGTGFLPTDEQQLFRTDDRDELYLVGTAEVPLAGMHLDEILDEVPVRYAGFSTCFRREAGAHGKDTRGILRVHQFDKVELFSFVAPEDGDDEHERLLAIEEEIFTGLGLHYQVVDIPVGDLGASAARKFDIEAWLPGQQAFREVTSTSNTTDYQARRLACRYRTEDGSTALVHTLNGTALAVQRAMIAVVETHQRPDGSVAVPDRLAPYLGREAIFTD